MQLALSCCLLVTHGKLVITSGYLFVTSGYFWLLLVSSRFSNNVFLTRLENLFF